MPSSMDREHEAAPSSPGYETRDANIRAIIIFLVILSAVLVFASLVCFAMFKHYSAGRATLTAPSPFSSMRQLPAGPQLQVNPRQDLLNFRAEQKKSLESYSWESRDDGTVRIPIERAMDMLLRQGLPVAPSTPAAEPSAATEKSSSQGSAKQ